MRIPSSLTSLVEEGLIEAVVRPLLSGKEAEVFIVRSGGELRVAKVYKDAQNRTFKNRAEYTEGRKVRNSRDQRAIDKRSRHGRAQDEAGWRSTEVDIIYRLREAGVRVPAPHHFIDGVLVMEMVTDAQGSPAPRLAEVNLDRAQAKAVFERLLASVVQMLCAGVVHGDLSDFNVLMAADGPVLIDFPQSVDASKNQNARRLLLRDVDNLKRFLSRHAPEHRPGPFAEEMWDLYASSLLTPETKLTGRHRPSERRANTAAVLDLIGDANYDERKRRERQGLHLRGVPAEQRPPPAPGDARSGAQQQAGGRWPQQGGNRQPDAPRPPRGGPSHGADRRAQPHHPAPGAEHPQQHAEHRQHRPQQGGPPREHRAPPSDNRPSDHRPSDHRPSDHRPSDHRPSDHRPSDHRPPDGPRPQHAGGGQRAGDHRQQHPGNRPPADRAPQQEGNRQRQDGGRPPPHRGEHRPQQSGDRQPVDGREHSRQQAGGPPNRGPAERQVPADGGPAAAPRRKVVVSVSTTERRRGPRGEP